jgi:UDP-glucose 4-epimerase
MRVLVTGGAGYIGTHTCVALLQSNHEVLVIDNLSNSSPVAIDRIKLITNRSIEFIEGDIRNHALLLKTMREFSPEAIIHFAGLKAVGESVQDPLQYYDVNVHGSLELLKAAEAVGCNLLVFSSSATVYGVPEYLPYDENHPTVPTNPYGQSKLMVERILQDWVKANNSRRALCLRYFNPVGAHISGLIGEDPKNIPNNLMPFIVQTAAGRRAKLSIFGDDYDTRDGTGERDYIHVSDLADGHLLALEKHKQLDHFQTINLGTGSGTTVKELIKEFEISTKQKIKTKISKRRPGDIPKSYANTELAAKRLDFKCTKSISDMCRDTWNWQKQNLDGY